MKLKNIGKGLYLFPGSPSTLIKPIDENKVVLVDPGYGEERCRQLKKALDGAGLRAEAVILTHGHPDHISAVKCLNLPVLAHRLEASIIEGSLLMDIVTYGARAPRSIYTFKAEDVKVDSTYTWGQSLYSLRAIALPGHSPGHTGLADEEGKTIYAGDAFFGNRLIRRVGVPFASDHEAFINSAHALMEYIDRGYKLVPSHGPIVDGKRARRLLAFNIERIEMVEKLIVDLVSTRPFTIPQLSFEVTRRMSSAEGMEVEVLLLNEVTIKSIISKLTDSSIVKPIIEDNSVAWTRL